ncbi:MAG TPA: hypothetical protein VGY57_02660 [Vicinamibacterales bacterium]|nr:hypothetical protein [Vicinamibacterales bacterium]
MVPFPAAAQSGADASSESDRVAWAELGAGVGAVGVPGEGGMSFPSATARMNITRRIAVDASAAFDVGPYTHGLSGFYVLQAHQTFGAAPRRIAPFATYGVLGSFSYQREPEYRYVLSTGDTVVIPARTYRRMTRPLGILVGGGARIRLAQRAYAEAGAELGAVDGGVVVIARAGLTIPIGAGR